MPTVSVQQALQMARQFQSAGRVSDAEGLYRQILTIEPANVEAMHGLGLVLYTVGNVAGSLEMIGRAAAVRPGDAAVQSDFGSVLLAAGQVDDAIAAFGAAIALKPDWADAHYNLGNALGQCGQLAAAVDAYRRAIALDATSFEAHMNCGNALLGLNRVDDAIAAFRAAVALRPELPDGHYNLGLALQRNPAHLDQSVESFHRALALRPVYPEALNGLGVSLQKKKQLPEAIAVIEQALALRPDFPEALSNLGAALQKANEPERALQHLRRALQLKPDFIEAKVNTANALLDVLEVDQAIALHREVLRQRPDMADVHALLSQALLLKGEYREAWEEHEWRFKEPSLGGGGALLPIDGSMPPAWHGEPLNGRRILLYVEQGMGDAINFVRYAPLVAERFGGRVLLLCRPALLQLFRSIPGVEMVTASVERLPPFDFQCSLMSLPQVFDTTVDTVPANIPYFFANPARIESWRSRMIAADCVAKRRVGLFWQGNPDHPDDRNRSISLAQLAPLAGASGVQFYSLQKGFGSEQVKSPPPGMELIDWSEEWNNYADTAAFVANLDLIIAVDTSIVHLAGALGKPVWVLLPLLPDPRWMLDREDTPWYPTMRLFRQRRRGQWDEVIARVSEALGRDVKT
jgi:tetratricopeptide (TPR) repeat protein